MLTRKIILSCLIIATSFSPALYAAATDYPAEDIVEITTDNPPVEICDQAESQIFIPYCNMNKRDFIAERRQAMHKFKIKEIEFLKSLNGIEKKEAEKQIEEFYKKAFADFPAPTALPNRKIINEIENLDIDQETKQLIINKLQANSKFAKNKARMQKQAIKFAKNILDMPPEKQLEELEDRNSRIQDHCKIMKFHRQSRKRKGPNNYRMMQDNPIKSRQHSVNNFQAQQLTIYFNNCNFFSGTPHPKGRRKMHPDSRCFNNEEKKGSPEKSRKGMIIHDKNNYRHLRHKEWSNQPDNKEPETLDNY